MSYLPISLVCNVQAQYTPLGFKGYTDNSIAIITDDAPLSDEFGSFGRYVESDSVASDFGSSSESYLQASAIFSQTPNVTSGGGYVAVIPRKNAIDTVSLGSAGTGYEVDDVLTVVQAGAAEGTVKVATIVAETGAIATVTVLTGGYDYSVATALPLSGGSGSAATINITAVRKETLVEVINRTRYSVYYRGVLTTFDVDSATHVATAATVQGMKDKIWGVAYSVYATALSVYGAITSAGSDATRGFYYGQVDAQTARISFAAAFGMALGVNYDGSMTCLAMHLKTLEGVTPDETVTTTMEAALDAAGLDFYPAWQWSDTMGNGYYSSGENRFFDQVANKMWIVGAMQTNVFNVLKTTNTKVPQTEAGMGFIRSAGAQICKKAVKNGFVAPGSWTSANRFGDPEAFNDGIELDGFYIYTAPISEQTAALRQQRIAPLLQVACKEAGAIHKADVLITINP